MALFKSSKWINDLLTRVGILETQVGAQPEQEIYANIAALKAETVYADGDGALVGSDSYIFVAASTATPDDESVVKPDNIILPNPGRWIRDTRFALLDHEHPDKADIIDTPEQDKFLISDQDGNPVEGATGPSDYSLDGHEHAEYLDSDDKTELEEGIASAIQAASGKMNVVSGMTEGDVGDIGTLNEFGQIVKSGKKTEYIPTQIISQALNAANSPGADNAIATIADLQEYLNSELLEYRRNMSVYANGEDGQLITYSATFEDVRPTIFDFEGTGVTLISWNANGFTINSKESGYFGYEAKKNSSSGNYRRNMEVLINAGNNQNVLYTNAFVNVRPVIFDYNGLGITLVSWNENGFTINSKEAGYFGYETLNNN